MSVYFVYRSHYDGPALKRVVRFEDASVLAWFQNRWRPLTDGELEQEMGGYVYGLDSLFNAIEEQSLLAPQSAGQLREYLESHLYVEGELLFSPHCIQVLTDDDELQMAYYFFDDQFLAKHADRAAYLLHEDWKLPDGEGPGGFRPGTATAELSPRGGGTGATYYVILAYYDSLNLEDLSGPHPFSRFRLPELCHYLATASPSDDWPDGLRLLRSQLFQEPPKATRQERAFLSALQENPGDAATWQVYSDWLEERGERRAGLLLLQRALEAVTRYPVRLMCSELDIRGFGRGGIAAAREEFDGSVKQLRGGSNHDPSRSYIWVGEHVAQLCLNTEVWGEVNLYHQWIFFDDLWASAHPALARAILRHASRWDVLS